MKNGPIRINDIVTRKDGVPFKIMKYGEPFGCFRALNEVTHEIEDLNIKDILVISMRNQGKLPEPDLEDLDDATRTKLYFRRKIVEQFSAKKGRTKVDALTCAQQLELGVRQFYRLWRGYNGTLRSLFRGHSDGGRGSSRLTDDAEKIMRRLVKKLYVKPDAKCRKEVIEAVINACNRKNVTVSETTIRRRMRMKPLKELAEGKWGAGEARNKFGAAPGTYKEATAPLRVVQIDHTPLDIVLVDEETGDLIGQGWLTIAIDVFSRMVVGLYLSYEDPNTGSVAMCIYRAVMDKVAYLRKWRVEGEWPIWGIMRTIHADNGPDFRTDELTFACHEHQIDIQWRPTADPMKGAHIERLAKTINDEIKKLKGGIPADFKERKNSKPEKNGIFSIQDAERYLVTWITNSYHIKFHEGIGTSPLRKYKQGMLEGPRPVGVPRKVSDPAQFLLDLTPCQERTVQRDGIEIDNMTYYDSILQRYIGARDPQHPKLARKFRCRTPIDDARVIYFQDPVTKEYHQIQCADKSMPPFTRHELKLVSRYLRAKEQKNIDMVAIKRGVEKLRQIIQETIEKRGKSAAAMSARRKKAVTQNLLESHSPLPHKTTAPESAPMPAKDYDPSEIQGF